MKYFEPSLINKTAIVFGGTSGINLGVAQRFAECGARVFVVSRNQEKVDAAVKILAEISSKHDGVMPGGYVADVRDEEAVSNAAMRAAQAGNGLDIVVSGAAGNFLCDAKDLSSKGFRTVVDIDLIGTFNVAASCYPLLNRPGATLIAISAPQGAKPVSKQIHACAAKAGVNMLTRCLALEWGPEGVRVNAISPGPIAETEGMKRLAGKASESDKLSRTLSLRRYGTISEIADAACFLASEQSSYINGVILDVDGGTMLGTGELV